MQSLKIKTTLRYLTMIFALVPALLIGIIGFFSMTGFAQSSVENYARHIGEAHSNSVNLVFGQLNDEITFLSCDTNIYSYADGNGNIDITTTKIPEHFDSIINNNNGLIDIVITDKNGSILYDHKGFQKVSDSVHPFTDELQSKINAYDTYVTAISNTYADGKEVFFVIRHINTFAENPDMSAGYIVEVVETSKISDVIKNSSIGEAKGYLAVTDGTEFVLNYNGQASATKLDGVDAQLKDVFTSEEKGENGNSVNYSASGKLGNFGRFNNITGANWKWVSIYPAEMSMTQIMLPAIIAIAVLIALAAGCIFLGQLVTKSITAPINTIISDMREIQAGNIEKRIGLNCKNEFKEISVLFNGLLDEVSLSEELHRTISNISDNMLFEWDFHKERMYLSPNFTEKFDIDASVAQLANGKFLDKLMSEEYADTYKRDISTLLKNKTGHSGEYQMLTKNGTIVWFGVRAQCITDRLGEPLRVIGVVTDIDNEKKLELQLSERASYDFLSQLYNRSTFEKELQSEIERNAHTKVGVLFIDVDDFKFINDRFGHSVGDEVIKYVSGCIKQRVKGSGFAGRFGGDEFVLCITDQQQIAEIESLSLDLIDELYAGYRSELANVFINVKASIGIAFSPEHGETGGEVIAAADEAMYFVKKNGKANYHIYQPEDSQMEDLQHTL